MVPVNFGYAKGCIYVHSSLKGRKMDILRDHPRVCFEVDLEVEVVTGERPCDYTTNYKSVIGFGQAKLLEDDEAKLEGLRAIMADLAATRPATVVLDPPRAGAAPDVLAGILAAAPTRVVYVSCNPATLARDLKILSDQYQVTSVTPVDLFPHTAHIECVAALVARGSE